MKNNISNINNNSGVIANNLDVKVIASSFQNSVLAKIIKILITEGDLICEEVSPPYEVKDKILYNNLKIYKDIIYAYYSLSFKCDKILNDLDNNFPSCKGKILRYINRIYLRAKTKVFNEKKCTNEIECIRENSDYIFQLIISELKVFINRCEEVKSIEQESIDEYIYIIVIYAFTECKILERPV